MRLPLVVAVLSLLVLPACAAKQPPEDVVSRFMKLRLTLDCESLWGELSTEARRNLTEREYVGRCREARNSALIRAMLERTTFRAITTERGLFTARVIVETDSPDPTEPFNEAFRAEVDAIGKEVVSILGGGAPADDETPPAPDAPRLTGGGSDAWMAEQISKPDAKRMTKQFLFRLRREDSRWRVDHDPLDQK